MLLTWNKIQQDQVTSETTNNTNQNIVIEEINANLPNLEDPQKYSFTLYEPFEGNSFPNIRLCLQNVFQDYIGYAGLKNIESHNNVKILKIAFYDAQHHNKLYGQHIKQLNATFYNYDQTTLGSSKIDYKNSRKLLLEYKMSPSAWLRTTSINIFPNLEKLKKSP
ncbi:hypothetical protein RclHR1_04850010 [Rhizophagus clarus]|uniref:Uncharacterized protein n=1 Tax=Rhizophagus clarus TaxID=94130 RepID=A0A2Z6S280_9GLOM|nr:hypothetical protein RclHR1_04850010 [Rhizophagus clarus]